jgi:hypothetical protein
MPTARLEHREGALRHVAADRVEDGVAIGHNLSEIFGVVVDDFIRAEAAHIVMVRRARSCNHTGADMLGKLNSKARDPARSAMDEDRLPRLQFQRVFDSTQRCETGERQGGGVDVR